MNELAIWEIHYDKSKFKYLTAVLFLSLGNIITLDSSLT
jgi:hypothetical protein